MAGPRKRASRLSTPGEHGGLVTLAGSATLATLVAPEHLVALASAAAFAVAFLSRGPLERAARKFRPRAWDRRAVVLYGVVLVGLIAFVGARDVLAGAITGLGAVAIPVAGTVVVKARVHRAFAVETLALGGCGGVAGVGLYAGGVAIAPAMALGLAMASYGAATVALVRAEVRDLDPAARTRVSWLAVLWLALGAVACAVTLAAVVAAFAPRAIHAVARAVFGTGSRRIGAVAARETVELLIFIGLLALLVNAPGVALLP